MPQPPESKPSKFNSPKLNFILVASAIAAMTLGAGAGVLLPLASSLRSPQAEGDRQARSSQPQDSQGLQQLNTMQLELIANRPNADLARNRARYILARRARSEQQPQKALDWLQGLENDYDLLAPQILQLRAETLTQMGNENQAKQVWQTLLDRKDPSPAMAEALLALAPDNPSYGDQAIAQFPSYPKTVELAIERLKTDPNNPDLLMLVVRHGLHTEALSNVLARLVGEANNAPANNAPANNTPANSPNSTIQLSPEDWADVGFAHWEKLDYGGGAKAYAKATPNAKHRYRTARSLQLSEQTSQAKPIYAQVVQDFPGSEEAGLSLKRLAEATEGRKALAYWDQLIQSYPDLAPEAMLQKSRRLDKLGSQDSASQMRQLLLKNYGESDAAAELRWELAEKYAQVNRYQEAIQLTQDIQKFNPGNDNAPRAIFWKARWKQKLDQERPAAEAFEALLKDYPDSYYAWRAAAILGMPVGDFFSVKDLLPEMKPHQQRGKLPAGSELLNELYGIGEDQAAWALWQTEFVNRQDPSVAEQFTDGLMRLGVGDHLDGIYMVNSLKLRQQPEDKAAYAALRQQPEYWYALYPLPFLMTSKQRPKSSSSIPCW